MRTRTKYSCFRNKMTIVLTRCRAWFHKVFYLANLPSASTIGSNKWQKYAKLRSLAARSSRNFLT